jgi:hypothetical protein
MIADRLKVMIASLIALFLSGLIAWSGIASAISSPLSS